MDENKPKNTFLHTALLIVILIALGFAIFKMFQKDEHLQNALKSLDSAQAKLDSALVQIDTAKTRVGTIQNDLHAYTETMNHISSEVQSLDNNVRSRDMAFYRDREGMKKEIRALVSSIQSDSKNFPPISVKFNSKSN